jgi:hypothetical protein
MQAQLVRQIPSRDWVMLDRQALEARFIVGPWTLDLAAHPVGSPDVNEYAWHVTASAGDEERHEDGFRTIGEVLAKYSFEPVPSDPQLAIYLDDKRDPSTERGWVVVRTMAEFQAVVLERGIPVVVSFDHDLDEGQPTGHDAARWFVDHCIGLEVNPHDIEWNSHSANPPGRENIEGLYASWCAAWDKGLWVEGNA